MILSISHRFIEYSHFLRSQSTRCLLLVFVRARQRNDTFVRHCSFVRNNCRFIHFSTNILRKSGLFILWISDNIYTFIFIEFLHHSIISNEHEQFWLIATSGIQTNRWKYIFSEYFRNLCSSLFTEYTYMTISISIRYSCIHWAMPRLEYLFVLLWYTHV